MTDRTSQIVADAETAIRIHDGVLRMKATLRRTRETLCDAAQLIDGAVKDGSWSAWDQGVRDAISARLAEIETVLVASDS